MKAQIYRLKITYDGYEKILNRTVDVSSNFTMAKLGYLVLAAFDTLAYHLFYLRFNGRRYELETDDNFRSIGMEEMTDPRTVKLNQLGMNIGDEISMCYDYGCDQMFTIKLESLADMEKQAVVSCLNGPSVQESSIRSIRADNIILFIMTKETR